MMPMQLMTACGSIRSITASQALEIKSVDSRQHALGIDQAVRRVRGQPLRGASSTCRTRRQMPARVCGRACRRHRGSAHASFHHSIDDDESGPLRLVTEPFVQSDRTLSDQGPDVSGGDERPGREYPLRAGLRADATRRRSERRQSTRCPAPPTIRSDAPRARATALRGS